MALVGQLGRHPAALATVATLMALFAILPGLPFLPFMAGAVVVGFCAYRGMRTAASASSEPDQTTLEAPPPEKSIGDMLDLDDIHVEFASDLVDMVVDQGTGLDARIVNMRKHIATGFGVLLPEVRLTDNPSFPPGTYAIHVQGVEQVRDILRPDRALVLLTDDTQLH